MKKVIATTMAAFLVAQVASAVSATVDFASAYVYRGGTMNDGLVVQPGIEGEVRGFTVGVWANIDADATDNPERVSEIDLYVGYGLGTVAGWDISAAYTELTYPGLDINGESDLSITAAGAIAGLPVSLTAVSNIAVEATPNYYEGSTGGSYNLLGVPLDLGLTVGFFDQEADSGFGYAAYSASYETGGGTLTVSYIDEVDGQFVTNGDGTDGVQESLILSYGISL